MKKKTYRLDRDEPPRLDFVREGAKLSIYLDQQQLCTMDGIAAWQRGCSTTLVSRLPAPH